MKREHMPALDGLRALAVLLVVAYHCRTPGAGDVMPGGFIGVDVFFVLSGFLITSLLRQEIERTGRIDVAGFYWRRVVRLMPALAALIVVFLALTPILWPDRAADYVKSAFLAATYATNYVKAPSPIGHTWSLAVEGQFYLLWPFAVWGLTKVRYPVAALAALYAAQCLLRIAGAGDWWPTYHHLETHSTGLIVGAALAFLPLRSAVAGWCGLGFVMVTASVLRWQSPLTLSVGLPLAEFGAALLLVGALSGGLLGRALSHPAARWVGAMSYGIYLWHYPVASLFRHTQPWWQTFLIVAPVSTVLAAGSFYTVEAWARSPRTRRPQAALP